MRTCLTISFLAVLATSAMAGPKPATVADLLDKGKTFDKTEVEVKGEVAKFEQRVSRSGRPYVVFRLTEKKRWVLVYGKGTIKTALKEGEKVKVTGTFEMEHHAGKEVFKNELIVDLEKGIKPAK